MAQPLRQLATGQAIVQLGSRHIHAKIHVPEEEDAVIAPQTIRGTLAPSAEDSLHILHPRPVGPLVGLQVARSE
eukprot:CAMPEP_0204362544 /NCGR_PEP_ID=MMETSP0469-20131031/39688_1 /ASSEMBLY_ACC=CAM_ASM_000384 /TAXON_ID=2969 /ORGANISM="Oxyrrhis marina" /LENGTH=73 /DNA_ID=CAMNT_0051351145 /DNA_START=491 /DNA_END=712 /DNA_ORIENTATION=+